MYLFYIFGRFYIIIVELNHFIFLALLHKIKRLILNKIISFVLFNNFTQ